jgi:hypothetical protein
MNGTDWPGESLDEWPEAFGFGDIAKGVLMPHTIPLSLGKRIIDSRRGSGGKVVQHTQPPPVAQNAREVQGQLTGLLKTVKAVEEKLDDTTRQLAVLQRASTGSQEAALFRQSLATAVLGGLPAEHAFNGFRLAAHLVPLSQNWRGAVASLQANPISTFAFPAIAWIISRGQKIMDKIEKDEIAKSKVDKERDEEEAPKWVQEFLDKLEARQGA